MHKNEELILQKSDIEIYYEDFVDEKNKNTIVILHGWGGNSQSWLAVGELLFQAGFNVIIPDLPGFGNTKLNKVFELDDYANVVEEFITKLGVKNIILWGHSNGGAISIKIANRGKIHINRLVLNNSAGIRNDKKRSLKRKILNNFTSIVKKILEIIPPRKNWKDNSFIKKIRKLFYRAIGGHDYLNSENNPYLKETYLNMIKSDLSETIPNIKQDTLIIWGQNDTYTPVSDGNFMRNKIKNSKIIVLENEKHGIHITSPKKLVHTFLKNI
ncbi:MAG: alpha/beta hydrolase [Candidatus Gracilibacteria bacterium]|nr:alpha/beta hydrolase [Candidatus Gracilibacteria bacterium]